MKVIPTEIPDILLFEPKAFADDRGFFLETWAQNRYAQHGVPASFVQDNMSQSKQEVLRGLHFQHPFGQGKFIHVLEGEVFDVAVDIRLGSPTFGKSVGFTLSAENHRQAYIPPGFAHGFLVTSSTAKFVYKCTELYQPKAEGSVRWNDPQLGIRWPISTPLLSTKDASAPLLKDIEKAKLPVYNPADPRQAVLSSAQFFEG